MNRFDCLCRNIRWLSLLIVFVICVGNVPSLNAQSKIDKGEEVKVLYLGDWIDGTVVDRKKNQYLIEYYWVSRANQKVFNRSEIRRLYEMEAIDFGRVWKSSGGSFELEAALKKMVGDDKVLLIKPDLSEIEVAIAKLGTSEQNYIKKFKRQRDMAIKNGAMPASWPDLPEIETYSDSSFGSSDIFNENKSLASFGAVPSYLREFTQKGVGFRFLRPRQEMISAIAVGGPEQWMLVNGREGNFFNRGVLFQSQLYWLSMKQQKVTASVAIANEDYALDYDPRTKYLVTYNEKEFARDNEEPTHLTVWTLGFGETSPKPLVRWDITEEHPRFGDFEFCKVINENIVLTQGKKNEFVGWDLAKKEIAYRIRTESFFQAPVQLTPDRKHLIIPEDGRISIFDTATGKFDMGVKVDARHVSGANINAAGTKLAAVSESNIYVWDLTASDAAPKVIPAPLVASPFKARIDWIDDDKVLVEGFRDRILFSLKLGIPLWSYKTANPFFDNGPLVNYVIDGYLFYTEQKRQNVAVGVVKLPGPKVEETTANIDPESLLALKKGSTVGIELNNVQSSGDVEAWLKEKIKENEWVYDDNGEFVMKAEMGIGESRTIEYESMGGLPRDRKRTSVSFQPHYSNLKIYRGNQIMWQTGTSTGPPPVITGGNVQSKIGQYQKPNVNFFKYVKVEQEIIDPKFAKGFGVSQLGRRGIEVVSTTPPGRADDPLAAAKEFEKEREKAREDRKKAGDENESGAGAQDN